MKLGGTFPFEGDPLCCSESEQAQETGCSV